MLAVIAVAFGLAALRLPIGELSHSGAGFFPQLVSCLLLFLASIIVAKSFVENPTSLHLNAKNIALVLSGLIGFIFCTKLLNMVVGIVWLVFVAALAGSSYSWQRNTRVFGCAVVVPRVAQAASGDMSPSRCESAPSFTLPGFCSPSSRSNATNVTGENGAKAMTTAAIETGALLSIDQRLGQEAGRPIFANSAKAM
ncbi:hypothetical protein V1294_005356 [Bradyrhizobium sp. AZCC 1678]|uniref:hypothetical protein n=1 Tax=Bradyrhizobium sp. AZCC 1678 TaxID=3117030 RepID=UPI002FF35CF0